MVLSIKLLMPMETEEQEERKPCISVEGSVMCTSVMAFTICSISLAIQRDVPHAVLIRGLKPIIGIETMQTRRQNVPLSKLCAGPGTLSQAMGIKTEHDGTSLSGHTIWIEEHGFAAEKKATPRIGIDYAGEDALLPYRFIVKDQSVFV